MHYTICNIRLTIRSMFARDVVENLYYAPTNRDLSYVAVIKNLLCPNTQIKKCKIYENKKFLYYDGLHLGEAGAKIISSAVIDKVNKISNSTKK